MGKTHRKGYAYVESNYRRPRGRKQALINKLRKKATPPDPWDDIPISREYDIPRRMVKNMISSNQFSREEMIRKLMKKFKMRYRYAREIVYWECHILIFKWQ